MHYLKSASFGELFGVTFTIAATAQATFALIGLVVAMISPGFFNANGVPTTSPVAAIGVLLALFAAMLFMNAGLSALGSGLWLLIRRFLPEAKAA